MTERLIAAARAVVKAHEQPEPPSALSPADWLRRQAEELEAKSAAIDELRAALEEMGILA